MTGESSEFKDVVIPAVVFTDPEVAWCGLTEAEAKEKGIQIARRTVAKYRTELNILPSNLRKVY